MHLFITITSLFLIILFGGCSKESSPVAPITEITKVTDTFYYSGLKQAFIVSAGDRNITVSFQVIDTFPICKINNIILPVINFNYQPHFAYTAPLTDSFLNIEIGSAHRKTTGSIRIPSPVKDLWINYVAQSPLVPGLTHYDTLNADIEYLLEWTATPCDFFRVQLDNHDTVVTEQTLTVSIPSGRHSFSLNIYACIGNVPDFKNNSVSLDPYIKGEYGDGYVFLSSKPVMVYITVK